jgi:hypothetical protein
MPGRREAQRRSVACPHSPQGGIRYGDALGLLVRWHGCYCSVPGRPSRCLAGGPGEDRPGLDTARSLNGGASRSSNVKERSCDDTYPSRTWRAGVTQVRHAGNRRDRTVLLSPVWQESRWQVQRRAQRRRDQCAPAGASACLDRRLRRAPPYAGSAPRRGGTAEDERATLRRLAVRYSATARGTRTPRRRGRVSSCASSRATFASGTELSR